MAGITDTVEQPTNTVGTKDWLESTKGMVIFSYVEPELLSLVAEPAPFTKSDFEAALKKVSRRVKK